MQEREDGPAVQSYIVVSVIDCAVIYNEFGVPASMADIAARYKYSHVCIITESAQL